jgi:hypothetical protein
MHSRCDKHMICSSFSDSNTRGVTNMNPTSSIQWSDTEASDLESASNPSLTSADQRLETFSPPAPTRQTTTQFTGAQ